MDQPGIYAIYARGWSIGSVLIRLASWNGRWSHCGLFDTATETIIEAVWPQGVVETSLKDFNSKHSQTEIVFIPVPFPALAYEFARQQVGKKYDMWGILGLIIKEPIARLNEWFCDELLEDSVIAGGRVRMRVPSRQLTVEQSYRTI